MISPDKSINIFLKLGTLEGLSYLAILFITMPLKYMLGVPEPSKLVGLIHGILFIGYVVMLAKLRANQLVSSKNTIILFALSIIPFGTFYLKRFIPHAH